MHRYASLDLDIVSDSSTTDKQSGESGRPRTLSLNLHSIYSLSTTLTHADAEPCRSVHHDSGANTCPRVPRAGVQLHDGGHTHATAMNTPLLAAAHTRVPLSSRAVVVNDTRSIDTQTLEIDELGDETTAAEYRHFDRENTHDTHTGREDREAAAGDGGDRESERGRECIRRYDTALRLLLLTMGLPSG